MSNYVRLLVPVPTEGGEVVRFATRPLFDEEATAFMDWLAHFTDIRGEVRRVRVGDSREVMREDAARDAANREGP